jgi:hypothetical protein
MAILTLGEFTEAVTALAEQHGVERLRDRLAHMNAFTSRRGLNSAGAIAERLHMLTGGLRRQVAATYAFSQLWNEMVTGRLGEEGEKRLEEQAEKVNACLDARESVVTGREEELDQALAAYRETLASVVGRRTAELDMLLKAVPSVADRLRAGVPVAPAEPAEES